MKTKLLTSLTGLKSFLKKGKKKYLLSFLILFLLLMSLAFLQFSGFKKEKSIILIFNRLLVFENQKLIWTSPKNWQVKDFFIADLTHDGKKDFNLIVYKKGRYGDFKPFWAKEDNQWGFHFFVLEVDGQKVSPAWQSSRVEKPICKAEAKDANGDGHEELIVQEGIYTEDGFSCQNTAKAIYQWNGWGFTKQENF